MNVAVVPGLYFKSYSRYTEARIPFETLALCGVVDAVATCESHVVDFNIRGTSRTFGRGSVTFPSLTLDETFYDRAATALADRAPDVLLFPISIHTNGNLHHAVQIARAARERLPRATVVFTGLGPSSRHDDLLRAFPEIDVVVRGEAEATVSALLQSLATAGGATDRARRAALAADLEGLTYLDADGAVRSTTDRPLIPDLDTLPMPALHYYGDVIQRVCEETRDFRYLSVEEHIHIEAGRGCPFRCTFCSNEHLWRRRYRLKSPERLVQEIRLCAEEYGGRKFLLHQQLFTANRAKTLAFCEALQASGLDVEWSCFTRNDCVDAEKLAAMRASGCRTVMFGIESGSQRIQDVVGKKTIIDEVTAQIQLTMSHGIKPQLSYIIGFPEETPADLDATMAMYLRYKFADEVESQLGLLAPAGGTEVLAQNLDDLQFDGVSTTTWYTRFFTPESYDDVAAHPRVFPQNWYIPAPNLPRELLTFLKAFDMAASYLTRSCQYAVTRNLLPDAATMFAEFRAWLAGMESGGLRARHWTGTLAWDTDVTSVISVFAQFLDEVVAPRDPHPGLLRSIVAYEQVVALLNLRLREASWDLLCTSTPPASDDNWVGATGQEHRLTSAYELRSALRYAAATPQEPAPRAVQTAYVIRAADAGEVEVIALPIAVEHDGNTVGAPTRWTVPAFRQVEF